MPDERRARGLVDTSVLIDPPGEPALPQEICIAAITLAELAAGVHATQDPAERADRQERLLRVEATLEALPFDAAAAGLPLYTRNVDDFKGLEGIVEVVPVNN